MFTKSKNLIPYIYAFSNRNSRWFPCNSYVLNSPLLFIDKNGDFPWPFLKEALIGAVSEFTFQVIDYMILENDYSFKAALNNLDYTNISAEALKSGFLAYVPFRSYTAIKISKLFLGKYRAYTFCIIKDRLLIIEDALNTAIKDYLNGEEIDITDLLINALGDKLVGEIMSSQPFVPKPMRKSGKKIKKKLDKAVKKSEKIRRLNKKLDEAIREGKKGKAERLKNRIHRQSQKIDDLQEQATQMLAQQYENSGWAETVKREFTNRAKNTVKNYVPKNTGKVVTIIAGELIENKDIDTDGVVPNNN